MSYPGPLSASVNLGCDTGLQRATDQFNFVVDDGAVAPGPAIPTSLQSPATITPAVSGSVSLTMAATGGNSSLSITSPNVSSVAVTGGSVSTLTLATTGTSAINSSGIFLNSSGGNDENFIHFSDPTAAGIAVYNNPGTPGQLSIGNDSAGGNVVATFNQTTNNVTLGSLGAAGTINLNASTVIKESASGVNGLALSPTSATQSVIAQTISNGGTLNLGSSVQNSDIIALRDTGAANTGSILIGGNGGTGIVMTGSINNAATTITTDRTAGNFGALTIGTLAGTPQLQFSESGVDSLAPLATGLGTPFTARGGINMNVTSSITNYSNSQTNANAALGNGASGTISSTNPPPNGNGLYCVTIYAPSDITANVSGIAYWNGSIWYGGSTGNAAFRIQSAPTFNALTLFNTSGVGMAGTWQSNVFQILGTL